MHILALIISIFLASISNVLLKWSQIDQSFKKKKTLMFIAFSLFFISTILTTFALYEIEMKVASSLSTLNYVFTFLISLFFLKESISAKKLFGFSFIITGILIFNH